MLAQYNARKSLQQVPIFDKKIPQQDEIVNSFYQQRRSRSSNVKHHNLLKKNISYFHQSTEKEEDEGFSSEDRYITSHQNSLNNITLPTNSPLIFNKNSNSIKYERPSYLQTSKMPPLPKNQKKESDHSRSVQSSWKQFQQVEEQYKQQLKYQLNKRINIQHYLTQIGQSNKENQTINQDMAATVKNFPIQKYDSRNSHLSSYLNQERMSISGQNRVTLNRQKPQMQQNRNMQESRNMQDSRNMQQSMQNSRNKQDSRNIQDSRNMQDNRNMQQSRNTKNSRNIQQSRHSIASIRDQLNNFQYSKNNQKTDRTQIIQHTFGSQQQLAHDRQSIHQSLNDRGISIKNKAQFEQLQDNVLTGEELNSLSQNSHPLRDPGQQQGKIKQLRLKYNYMDPEQQSHYKTRIKDLQKQLQQVKQQHRKEDKLIQSICKMRKVMLQTEQDCGLKQLWRWIKQLPTLKHKN